MALRSRRFAITFIGSFSPCEAQTGEIKSGPQLSDFAAKFPAATLRGTYVRNLKNAILSCQSLIVYVISESLQPVGSLRYNDRAMNVPSTIPASLRDSVRRELASIVGSEWVLDTPDELIGPVTIAGEGNGFQVYLAPSPQFSNAPKPGSTMTRW